jgi:hypothetical protein
MWECSVLSCSIEVAATLGHAWLAKQSFEARLTPRCKGLSRLTILRERMQLLKVKTPGCSREQPGACGKTLPIPEALANGLRQVLD